MNKELILNKKVCIGKDRYDKSNVYIELNITKITNDERETIEHKSIKEYTTISISGYARRMGGQIYDSINNLEMDLNNDEICKELVKIWKEWHLNDLQPNCIHQKAFNCNLSNYEDLALRESAKCPNGYNYGSKWLVKEILQSDIDKITKIFTELSK